MLVSTRKTNFGAYEDLVTSVEESFPPKSDIVKQVKKIFGGKNNFPCPTWSFTDTEALFVWNPILLGFDVIMTVNELGSTLSISFSPRKVHNPISTILKYLRIRRYY